MDIFEQRYQKRFQLWNNRHEFGNKHNVWYTENFEDQDATQIVKDIRFYESENIAAKMKLKKGEQDHVLFAFD